MLKSGLRLRYRLCGERAVTGAAECNGISPRVDAVMCTRMGIMSGIALPVESKRISSASTAAAADLNTPPAPAKARSAAVRGRTPANLPNSSRTGTQDCLRSRPCATQSQAEGQEWTSLSGPATMHHRAQAREGAPSLSVD